MLHKSGTVSFKWKDWRCARRCWQFAKGRMLDRPPNSNLTFLSILWNRWRRGQNNGGLFCATLDFSHQQEFSIKFRRWWKSFPCTTESVICSHWLGDRWEERSMFWQIRMSKHDIRADELARIKLEKPLVGPESASYISYGSSTEVGTRLNKEKFNILEKYASNPWP